MSKKEKITPPKKSTLKAASKDLRKRGTLGGRVEAEESVAVKQRVVAKKAIKKKGK